MKSDLQVLRGQISDGLDAVDSVDAKMRRFRDDELGRLGRTDMSAMIATKILESFYTSLETIFVRISQHFENNLDSQKWHKDLLDKMKIQVPGLRERALSDETVMLLDELRRFRHFSWYYLALDYDWERLDFLIGVYDRSLPMVKRDLAGFVDFLERLGAE